MNVFRKSLLVLGTSLFISSIGSAATLSTWIGQERNRIGTVLTDLSNPNIRTWSANGASYRCVTERIISAENRVIVNCPSINYRMELTSSQIIIGTSGGVQKYPGGWDERRAWKFNVNANVSGNFVLHDNYTWIERQYRQRAIVATFYFKEVRRDANYIYLHDASRNANVALGRTKAFLKNNDTGQYNQLYNGSW